MILANITILPLWATCALWNAIAPTPICAAFRSPPSLTARCSKALCRGSAELPEAYFFSELQRCGTPQQAAFALLRLHGYSIAEIAAQYKLDPRRVRRMLKSLYSAYLRFHEDGREAKK